MLDVDQLQALNALLLELLASEDEQDIDAVSVSVHCAGVYWTNEQRQEFDAMLEMAKHTARTRLQNARSLYWAFAQ